MSENVYDYLHTVPKEIIEIFREEYGQNGWDVLVGGSIEDAKEMLKHYTVWRNNRETWIDTNRKFNT